MERCYLKTADCQRRSSRLGLRVDRRYCGRRPRRPDSLMGSTPVLTVTFTLALATRVLSCGHLSVFNEVHSGMICPNKRGQLKRRFAIPSDG